MIKRISIEIEYEDLEVKTLVISQDAGIYYNVTNSAGRELLPDEVIDRMDELLRDLDAVFDQQF